MQRAVAQPARRRRRPARQAADRRPRPTGTSAATFQARGGCRSSAGLAARWPCSDEEPVEAAHAATRRAPPTAATGPRPSARARTLRGRGATGALGPAGRDSAAGAAKLASADSRSRRVGSATGMSSATARPLEFPAGDVEIGDRCRRAPASPRADRWRVRCTSPRHSVRPPDWRRDLRRVGLPERPADAVTFEVAVASDRSHQPGHPRHRQAARRRHRRPDDQRRPQDARRGPARARTHRRRRRHDGQGAAQGRPHRLRRRRHQRPARRPRVGRDAADLRHRSRARPGDHGRRQERDLRAPRKASRTTTKKARARSTGCSPTQEGRRHRRLGQRHDAVRARRAHRARARPARASSSSPATRAPSCRRSST